jgi:hypothetical protein
VVRLVGAVARPEPELIEELDDVEQFLERLLWKELVAKADAGSSHFSPCPSAFAAAVEDHAGLAGMVDG